MYNLCFHGKSLQAKSFGSWALNCLSFNFIPQIFQELLNPNSEISPLMKHIYFEGSQSHFYFLIIYFTLFIECPKQECTWATRSMCIIYFQGMIRFWLILNIFLYTGRTVNRLQEKPKPSDYLIGLFPTQLCKSNHWSIQAVCWERI